MSDFILEINEPAPNLLSIETSFMEEVVDTIDIQFVDTVNVDIVNTEKFLVTDLPDNIPFTKIVGNIDYLQSNFTVNVDELIWNNNQVGLDGYLDQYNFDGGTP
jgi:hypothetical protein